MDARCEDGDGTMIFFVFGGDETWKTRRTRSGATCTRGP